MGKCINIDWLEVYCLEEESSYPHDAEFFRRQGWSVRVREYGTPMYRQMFTLINHYGEDEIEIRREPKSEKSLSGLFDKYSCHVRLCNRTCYYNQAALFLKEFLEKNGLKYQRISRIDIALDFVRFDYGDYPAKFLRRYMEGKYAKINQANIAAHGSDAWDGRTWNSVSWGAPKSMVKTRFYCKSLELKQVHNKPYIRQAWKVCGLVDDEITLTKKMKDGTETEQSVWRVEFQIKSGTKNWFVMNIETKKHSKIRSVRNDLDAYKTRADIYNIFLCVAEHYFHFKKFKEGVRKNRCPDKNLFQCADIRNFYKLDSERVAGTGTSPIAVDRLLERLIIYRDTHPMPDIFKACNVLIAQLEFERRTAALNQPWPRDEVELLQRLIAKRIKGSENTLSLDIKETKELIELEKNLFNEEI